MKRLNKNIINLILGFAVIGYLVSCKPSAPDPPPVYPSYDLPYTLSSIDVDDIDRCMSDGVITNHFKDLAGVWRKHVTEHTQDIHFSNSDPVRKQQASKMLKGDYISIGGYKLDNLKYILNGLKEGTPELSNISLDIYLVKNKDGTPYYNASTLPGGAIYFGEELYDVCMHSTQSQQHCIAFMISHEIGHTIIGIGRQEHIYLNRIVDKLPKSLQSLGSKTFRKLVVPMNDAEEALCDMVACKILADHPNYDPIEGLKIYKRFAKEEDNGSAPDWADSHPNSSHRESCLLSLLYYSKIQN